jgi:hypothetical protein
MSFKEEMELLRLKRLTAITKNRDMRIYLHTRKMADLDTATANGAMPSEDIEDARDRENREYEYDMASFQSALDDLNEPDLPRITPAMLAVWTRLQEMKATQSARYVVNNTPDLRSDLWHAFIEMMTATMDGGE